MMGMIAGHFAMLIFMWIVLGLIGLNILVQLITKLRGSSDLGELATLVTRPMLLDILPLIILAMLTALPNFHIVMLIWYFVAAVLIAIRSFIQLGRSIKSLS